MFVTSGFSSFIISTALIPRLYNLNNFYFLKSVAVILFTVEYIFGLVFFKKRSHIENPPSDEPPSDEPPSCILRFQTTVCSLNWRICKFRAEFPLQLQAQRFVAKYRSFFCHNKKQTRLLQMYDFLISMRIGIRASGIISVKFADFEVESTDLHGIREKEKKKGK